MRRGNRSTAVDITDRRKAPSGTPVTSPKSKSGGSWCCDIDLVDAIDRVATDEAASEDDAPVA